MSLYLPGLTSPHISVSPSHLQPNSASFSPFRYLRLIIFLSPILSPSQPSPAPNFPAFPSSRLPISISLLLLLSVSPSPHFSISSSPLSPSLHLTVSPPSVSPPKCLPVSLFPFLSVSPSHWLYIYTLLVYLPFH